MLNETFEQRLRWFDKNQYERSNSKFTIKETEESGTAEIECHLSNNALKFKFDRKQKMALHYLENKKVADAVVFEFSKPQKVIIHIFECKKTVKSKEWEKIKRQFEGAVLNALGVIGVLGLSHADIQDIIFYTAYRTAAFTPDNLRTRGGLKSEIRDWIDGKVSILSVSATHKKIELDSSGKGSVSI